MNRADVDYLEAVQLGKRPHAVLIAVEEAEDATQNAVEGIGEGLRGSVEQRRHGEGDDALRVVEDVADVLASCRTALHHAVHVLGVNGRVGENGVVLEERRGAVQQMGAAVDRHRVLLEIQLVPHNHDGLLFLNASETEETASPPSSVTRGIHFVFTLSHD